MSKAYTSLTAAITAGAPTFFTGKPCKRGHISVRRTPDGSCIECIKHRTAIRMEQRAADREAMALREAIYAQLRRLSDYRPRKTPAAEQYAAKKAKLNAAYLSDPNKFILRQRRYRQASATNQAQQ